MTGPALAIDDPVLWSFASEVGADDPIEIVGAGTRRHVGGPVAAGARPVSAPSGVVAVTPAEMTVVVRTGTLVADLHRLLAEHGQRTGLPDRGGTVGGAVAVGENHLEVRARGPVRSTVLQVRYVSADGCLVTGGGPTVKNVTGFDLPRLLVGSLGTLGVLAEVVLRTNPIPAVSQWFTAADVDPFAVDRVLLRPGAVLWDGRSRVWVLLEGHEVDVSAQLATLGPIGSFAEAEGPPARPARRWSLPPADLADLGRVGLDPNTASVVASIGVGTVWADQDPPPRSLQPGVEAIGRRLKQNFDPTGRLNPGRTVGAG